MDCAYCKLKEIKEALIFEDEDIIVAVNPFPIVEGEIIIFPKKHYTILEEIPNNVIEKIGLYSKYFSMILFESLKCEGTNIYVENGTSAGQLIPHFAVSLIPRWKDDNINFSWIPKPMPQNEFDIILDKLKENLSFEDIEIKKEEKQNIEEETTLETENKETKERETTQKTNEKNKKNIKENSDEEIDYRYENYFNRQP